MKINNFSNQPINNIKNNNNIKAKKTTESGGKISTEDKKDIISSNVDSDHVVISSKPPFEKLPSVPLDEKMAKEMASNISKQITTAEDNIIPSQAKFELKRVLALIN